MRWIWLVLTGMSYCTTALHAAISQLHEANENDKDIVKHRTLLSLAVLENHLDVVKLILKEDPAYERVTGSKKSDLKSLIPLAPREGHKDIVKILCETYEAGRSGQAGHILLIDAIKEGDKGEN
ncbi:hypothetical protein POM88_015840 [Heracleum sosnowskyi]|uniref:Uncharacterized protein n=1 Tax=Heracleum sosnowskyi TaxID=360622 RepID=A0AAD8MWR9_9APIA|nr:hypothetical protein POM88_015840 [Heracleum sosnowskyi]